MKDQVQNKIFKFSDQVQQRILEEFDNFVNTSIVGNKSYVTKCDQDVFTVYYLDKCKDAFNAQMGKGPKVLATFVSNLQNGQPQSNNQEQNISDSEAFQHIIININWLYNLCSSNINAKNQIKSDSIKEAPFFFEGVAGFGQSTSAEKNAALLFFIETITHVKQERKIQEDIDPKKCILEYCSKKKEENNDSKHPWQGIQILRYLCAPILEDSYSAKLEGNFPVMAKNDFDAIGKLIAGKNINEIAKKIYEAFKISDAGRELISDIDWKNPFYSPYIIPFWRKDKVTDFTEDNALKYKHAIILYGPPGTSKTYRAKELAARILRSDESFDTYIKKPLESEKEIASRIHRLQLHTNYTYDDFVWGYQIEGGQSVAKKGYFLRLLDKMAEDPNKSHVLILDEINRVDISRIFGELFSAIENRGEVVELQQVVEGVKSIVIPKNLYVIGTMNEIDFSLERVDFALRRRFLWYFYGFKEDRLRRIIHSKWNESLKDYTNEIEPYIKVCKELNNKISSNEQLGEQYQIGHTYFAEVVDIMKTLSEDNNRFKKAKQIVWDISIKPILEAYMGNMDKNSVKELLDPKDKEEKKSFRFIFLGKRSGEETSDD